MNLKIVKVLALGLLVPAAAQAAPRAESAQECSVAADMAVVARSLADEKIQKPKAAAIMARIYDVGESERGSEILKDILDTAYRSRSDGRPGIQFAEEIFAACMKDGDMDDVLGSRL